MGNRAGKRKLKLLEEKLYVDWLEILINSFILLLIFVDWLDSGRGGYGDGSGGAQRYVILQSLSCLPDQSYIFACLYHNH